MKWLDIEVSPGDGIKSYWIAVGFDDVVMVNDKGSIQIQENRKHILTWWMVGTSGASLKIKGTNRGGVQVVEVKETKIPSGEFQGAGTRRFTMV